MIAWVDVETTGLDERDGDLLEVALVVTDDDLNSVDAFEVTVRPLDPLEKVIEKMDPYVREMHTKNGLLDDVAARGFERGAAEQLLVRFVNETFASVPSVPVDKCFYCGKRKEKHSTVPAVGVSAGGFQVLVCNPDGPTNCWAPKTISALSQTPFAGSTVSFDRRWLRAQMPALEALVSYRSIDVSSLTELAKRWAPAIYAKRPGAAMQKEDMAHRALPDVRESIKILKYYVEAGFILKNRETVFRPSAA